MASAALLLALSLLSLLSIGGVYARPGIHFHPCNTLLISYTISSSSSSADSAALRLSQIAASADQNHFRTFAVYRIIRPLRPYYYSASLSLPEIRRPIPTDRTVITSEHAAFGLSSLQERAKDIIFVVVGLLFGVGCGALTAATMYLAWSLVTNRYEICCAADDEFEEDSADESPKKFGYVRFEELISEKEGHEVK